MYRSGHEFLSGPGVPADQHIRPGRGYTLDESEYALHGLGFSDQVGTDSGARLTAELGHFPLELQLFHRPGENVKQLLGTERLLDEVDRPELHRLDGTVDRSECRHHDELGVGLQRRARPEHVEPVHSRQVQVQQDQVVQLGVQLPKALLTGPDCLYPITVLGKNRKKEFTNVLLVLDDQDPRRNVAFRLFIPHRYLRALAIDGSQLGIRKPPPHLDEDGGRNSHEPRRTRIPRPGAPLRELCQIGPADPASPVMRL